ncbi:DUF6390 family protein [Mycobacterium sp. B14F4]|uniref:DUF6390 family protein n=1 Tax=Mycobacterium sp. B14F4 TaxID=3153565 RepID=UPI00325EA39A
MTGDGLFASYAYPPNELGYCGPADTAVDQLAAHASEFDGAWPYLLAIADGAGVGDPLDTDVVRNYWIGGRLLDKVDGAQLLARLREAFSGQVTGLLADLSGPDRVLAHHSFHVFVVYPWIRFLDRDPATPLRVMQSCRIRWGTVDAVHDDHATIMSRPLILAGSELRLGDPVAEHVRWNQSGTMSAARPTPGQAVTAHWDWLCGALTDDEVAALELATGTTLDLVNRARRA